MSLNLERKIQDLEDLEFVKKFLNLPCFSFWTFFDIGN